jgi:hypothetical protein
MVEKSIKEKFDDILVSYTTKKIDNTRLRFEKMDYQLKARAEK